MILARKLKVSLLIENASQTDFYILVSSTTGFSFFFCQSGHKKLNYYTELVLCSQDSNRFCRTKAVLEFHFFDTAPLSTV